MGRGGGDIALWQQNKGHGWNMKERILLGEKCVCGGGGEGGREPQQQEGPPPDAALPLAVGEQQRKLQVGLPGVGQLVAVPQLHRQAGVGVHAGHVHVRHGASVVGAQVPLHHQAVAHTQPPDRLPALN